MTLLYFSSENTLLSILTDGSDIKVISSTVDNEDINGIVVFD